MLESTQRRKPGQGDPSRIPADRRQEAHTAPPRPSVQDRADSVPLLLFRVPVALFAFALAVALQGAPAAGQEPAPGPEAQQPEDAERIHFDRIPLSEESGGGFVEGSAAVVEFDGTKGVLAGDVVIRYQDIEVRADRVELDQETEDLVAEGNVVFDRGPERMTGALLEYNLKTKTGRLVQATGNMGTDYFFSGAEVLKTGEDTYRILDGSFTSCQGPTPAWSFRAKRVDLRVDGYAKVRGATFRAKKAPLLYFPYILWPVKDDRTSGFLIPKPGYSRRRGASLGLAYYWAMGRSYDTTLNLDLFFGGTPENALGTGNYVGIGNELRYRPSEFTEGLFEGYGIEDPEFDEFRWRIRYSHRSTKLPLGLRAVVNVIEASDFDYFQDFERRGDRNSIRQTYSTGYLSGNWGAHSLNMNLDQRQTFISDTQTVTLRQLPEIEYKLRSTRLGPTPFYLQMRSSVHYLDVDRSALLENSYGRADLFPELTLPVRTFPWLSLSLTTGGRVTWYGDSLFTSVEKQESPGRQSDFRGESFTRFVPTASAEIVGPSFTRIYEGGGKRFGKFKHVVEPRITYAFLEEDEEQERAPLFDEVDPLPGTNAARFSLFNRVLGKLSEDQGGGSFEIFSFEISQDYSFDEPLQMGAGEERQEGPLRSVVRYNPSRRTLLQAEVRYNTLFSTVESTDLTASYGFGKTSNLGVRWSTRTNAESGEIQANQVRLGAGFPVVPRRLRLQAELNYDIERSLAQLQRYFLLFQGSCYDITLELGEFKSASRRDREFRFMMSLKNVGTFFDITGGESETL